MHQIFQRIASIVYIFIHMWNEKNVDRIQKRHSEIVSPTSRLSWWFKKQSQARMAEACGSKKTCRCTTYTQRVEAPRWRRLPTRRPNVQTGAVSHISLLQIHFRGFLSFGGIKILLFVLCIPSPAEVSSAVHRTKTKVTQLYLQEVERSEWLV